MRRFRCILFLATSAGCGLGCNSSQPISSPVVADTEHQAVTQPEPEPAPTVAEVTELLERGHRHCGVGPVVPHPLERIGEKAFPALEAILANPKTESRPIGNTLVYLLLYAKGSRSQFIDPAIARLTDDDLRIRYAAVKLLGQIGSSRDIPPVIVLLSDPDRLMPIFAAETVAAIGDRRALDAFDVWLKSEAYRKHELGDELLLRVKLQRDSLQKRLDDQPKKLLDGK